MLQRLSVQNSTGNPVPSTNNDFYHQTAHLAIRHQKFYGNNPLRFAPFLPTFDQRRFPLFGDFYLQQPQPFPYNPQGFHGNFLPPPTVK
uniref:Uncharacterized protein n=1 Tax=Megaselia scalaris TaxID=36166 RepID=T1GL69_MEGSC